MKTLKKQILLLGIVIMSMMITKLSFSNVSKDNIKCVLTMNIPDGPTGPTGACWSNRN